MIAPRITHAAATHTVCVSGPPTCDYASIAAAVAASGNGDTVTVAAGTYTEPQIVVSHAITLQGAGAGSTIIKTPMNTAGMIRVYNPNPLPNPAATITIAGFTIEGTGTAPTDEPFFIVLKDQNPGDTVAISGMHFLETATTDPGQSADFSVGVWSYHSFATAAITNNDFDGVWQGVLLEESTGQASVSGNTFHNLVPSTQSSTTYDPEAVFDFTYGGTAVSNTQTISNNVFKDYGGSSVAISGGYTGAGAAVMSNISITNNQVTLSAPTGAAKAIVGETRDGGTINGLTISSNTINVAGTETAITLDGDVRGASITSNIVGSGTSATAGVRIENTVATTGATITGNRIASFVDGLSADNLATTAIVAQHNCLINNTSYGAVNGTGSSLTADHNWWGDASGPHNATSNPSGTGNAVSDNVIYAPFSTAPETVCTGPVTTNVVANPNPVVAGATSALTATASDSTTANYPIASAQYSVDGGAYSAMSAQDGSFDSVTESVKATVPAFSGPGTHTLCVRATDAAGNIGAKTCFTLSVGVVGNGGAAAGARPVTPQGPTGGPVASSSGNGTSNLNGSSSSGTSAPQSAAPSASGSGFPVALLVLVLILVGAAGGALFVLRQRGLLGRFLSR